MTNLNLANLGIAAIVISNINNSENLIRLQNANFTDAVWDNDDDVISYINQLLDSDDDFNIDINKGKDFQWFAKDLNNGGFDLDQDDFVLFTRILN